MSFLGPALVSLCVGAGSGYQDACSNALIAGSKQTGMEHDFNIYEEKTSEWAKKLAESLVPEDDRPIAGGIIFIAKTAVDRKLDVPIPTLGLCDKMESELRPGSAMLILNWQLK